MGVLIPTLQTELDEAKEEYKRSAAKTKRLADGIPVVTASKTMAYDDFVAECFSIGKRIDEIARLIMHAERCISTVTESTDMNDDELYYFNAYITQYNLLRQRKEALRVSSAATKEARLRLVYAEDALAQHMRRLQKDSCLPLGHAKNIC